MIKGLTELNAKLTKLGDIEVSDIIERATRHVQDEVKLLVPVDTGELRNSISYEMNKEAGTVSGVVFTNLEYAPYVEFGTGPKGSANHSGISPELNPRYSVTGWSYFDEKTGEWIHTTGQKAQPFMYPGMNNSKDKIKKFISSEVDKKIKKIAGG